MYAFFGHLATEKERENESPSAHPFILYFPLSVCCHFYPTNRSSIWQPACHPVCLFGCHNFNNNSEINIYAQCVYIAHKLSVNVGRVALNLYNSIELRTEFNNESRLCINLCPFLVCVSVWE